MKCSVCVSEGKKSTIRGGITRTSAAYCAPFYDEDGKYHHHDRNRRTAHYTCSNGHSWSEVSINECWCGWGKK